MKCLLYLHYHKNATYTLYKTNETSIKVCCTQNSLLVEALLFHKHSRFLEWVQLLDAVRNHIFIKNENPYSQLH